MAYSLDPDQIAARYANHVGKLFDRLDNEAFKIDLKDYCAALLAARQLVLGLIAVHKSASDADTGSAVRRYAPAFANAASQRAADTGATAQRRDAGDDDTAPAWDADDGDAAGAGDAGVGQ